MNSIVFQYETIYKYLIWMLFKFIFMIESTNRRSVMLYWCDCDQIQRSVFVCVYILLLTASTATLKIVIVTVVYPNKHMICKYLVYVVNGWWSNKIIFFMWKNWLLFITNTTNIYRSTNVTRMFALIKIIDFVVGFCYYKTDKANKMIVDWK